MGYFLFYENMLESVLVARDLYLKEDGLMFPGKCRIKIAGFYDRTKYQSKIEQWECFQY